MAGYPGFALARYNANGTLDSGFGNGGKVTTAISGSGGDYAGGVVVQSDGKIVLAGYSLNGSGTMSSNYDFALARYNANGTLDSSFGSGGKVITPTGTNAYFGMGVAATGVPVSMSMTLHQVTIRARARARTGSYRVVFSKGC